MLTLSIFGFKHQAQYLNRWFAAEPGPQRRFSRREPSAPKSNGQRLTLPERTDRHHRLQTLPGRAVIIPGPRTQSATIRRLYRKRQCVPGALLNALPDTGNFLMAQEEPQSMYIWNSSGCGVISMQNYLMTHHGRDAEGWVQHSESFWPRSWG
ncbi:hypothetical protein CDO25_11165 [Sinorhizobium meliloti]|nr:hypothetical protein CDO25_11165 [Sinorhizobium meliloti]